MSWPVQQSITNKFVLLTQIYGRIVAKTYTHHPLSLEIFNVLTVVTSFCFYSIQIQFKKSPSGFSMRNLEVKTLDRHNSNIFQKKVLVFRKYISHNSSKKMIFKIFKIYRCSPLKVLMGTPMAPNYANLFLDKFENEMIN